MFFELLWLKSQKHKIAFVIMNVIDSVTSYQTIILSLEPDEKLLESIQEVVSSHDIRNGIVVSGVGTLKRCHLHYVNTTTFPPENKF